MGCPALFATFFGDGVPGNMYIDLIFIRKHLFFSLLLLLLFLFFFSFFSFFFSFFLNPESLALQMLLWCQFQSIFSQLEGFACQKPKAFFSVYFPPFLIENTSAGRRETDIFYGLCRSETCGLVLLGDLQVE